MSAPGHSLEEEAAFANAEYERLRGDTGINPKMLRKYAEPTQMWDWRQRAAISMGELRGRDLLDYGCGQGEEAAYFASLGANVTAVDISNVGLEVGRARAAANQLSINFQKADCLHLPFPDESFDLVHGHGILHHVGLEAGLAEIHRVLRRDGVAVFLEPLQTARSIEVCKEWLSSKLPRFLGIIPVTSGEENLRPADIEKCASSWSAHEVHLFHLVHRARKILMPRAIPLWHGLRWLDHQLMTLFPSLQKFAGGAVIYLRK